MKSCVDCGAVPLVSWNDQDASGKWHARCGKCWQKRQPCRYVALVIGELVNEELDLPPLPDPVWAEGEYPHGIRGEGWVGFAVAAFPKAAAERLCCAEIDMGALWPFDDDAVREYFDREASDATERWNEYRIVCAARDIALEMGGSVMLVRGELP